MEKMGKGRILPEPGVALKRMKPPRPSSNRHGRNAADDGAPAGGTRFACPGSCHPRGCAAQAVQGRFWISDEACSFGVTASGGRLQYELVLA